MARYQYRNQDIFSRFILRRLSSSLLSFWQNNKVLYHGWKGKKGRKCEIYRKNVYKSFDHLFKMSHTSKWIIIIFFFYRSSSSSSCFSQATMELFLIIALLSRGRSERGVGEEQKCRNDLSSCRKRMKPIRLLNSRLTDQNYLLDLDADQDVTIEVPQNRKEAETKKTSPWKV